MVNSKYCKYCKCICKSCKCKNCNKCKTCKGKKVKGGSLVGNSLFNAYGNSLEIVHGGKSKKKRRRA